MPTRIIRTSTTPPWWRWRWIARRARRRRSITARRSRGREEWILGLQSKNGAWGAFDADNEYYYLNNIPFADHGALLDPPTEDVTARCVSMLAQLGQTPENSPAVAAGVDYLKRTQLADGSWYGRWGMNYIYGTWSVLCALNAAGVDHAAPEMRKAADWLIAIQNADGGWGEDGSSYKLDYKGYEPAPSTASQTAWALLGLMATGDTTHPAVKRGIAYLMHTQGAGRLLGRGALHRDRFPARVLSALPRLPEVLPALGDGALSQPDVAQRPHRHVRDVGALALFGGGPPSAFTRVFDALWAEPGIQSQTCSACCDPGFRARTLARAPRNDRGESYRTAASNFVRCSLLS